MRKLLELNLARAAANGPIVENGLARIIHDSDLLFHLRAVHARHLPLLIN
jgi:hypothetical protein